MKTLALILTFMAFNTLAYAESLEDTFQKIGKGLCDKVIAEKNTAKETKSLKLKGTLIEEVCSLTARTALMTCSTDAAKIYKGSVSSKEKEKVSKMIKSSLAFCADYSELASADVVNVIIKKSETEKLSVDEASKKILVEAAKLRDTNQTK